MTCSIPFSITRNNKHFDSRFSLALNGTSCGEKLHSTAQLDGTNWLMVKVRLCHVWWEFLSAWSIKQEVVFQDESRQIQLVGGNVLVEIV